MTTERINALLAQAYGAQQSGDRDAAVRIYNEVLALAPEHPGALNSLGIMAINAGDARTSAAYHARAATADPTAGPLWLNLARAQREMGDRKSTRLNSSHVD